MNAQEFKHILDIGLGRAILYLQKHDAAPYRDIILNACLHSTVYDRQIEGSRAAYLFEIITLTGEIDFYRDHILDALWGLSKSSHSYDVAQLYDLASEFAFKGDREARLAIYEKFEAQPALGSDFEGASAVVDIGGINGLVFVADRLGTGEYDIADEGWLFVLIESILNSRGYKRAKIYAVLEQAGAKNPSVVAFYKAMRNYLIRSEKRSKTPREWKKYRYDVIKKRIEDKDNFNFDFYSNLRGWGNLGASHEEFHQAAEDLLKEDDEERLLAYLHIFAYKPFPLDPSKLILLHKTAEENLARVILMRLEKIAHPLVRAYALQNPELHPEKAARLLEQNYQEGDWVLLKSLTERELDRDEAHGIGFPIRSVFRKYPSEIGAAALLNLYGRCPCSWCRADIVELLFAVKRLPEAILDECKFDSNSKLRKAARDNFPNLDKEYAEMTIKE